MTGNHDNFESPLCLSGSDIYNIECIKLVFETHFPQIAKPKCKLWEAVVTMSERSRWGTAQWFPSVFSTVTMIRYSYHGKEEKLPVQINLGNNEITQNQPSFFHAGLPRALNMLKNLWLSKTERLFATFPKIFAPERCFWHTIRRLLCPSEKNWQVERWQDLDSEHLALEPSSAMW